MSSNNLLSSFPEISREWHSLKNGKLTPRDISIASNKKVWWKCQKGHEWEAIVANRTRLGSGCPYCARLRVTKERSLQVVNPDLAKSWHPSKNGYLKPTDVSYASSMKVWWQCAKGHEWEATVNNRSKGRGCPQCAGKIITKNNCLAEVNPSLVKEWSLRNGTFTPSMVLPNSNKKAWWKCAQGHEWQASIYSRNAGVGCPICSGRIVSNDNRLSYVNPDLSLEWHPVNNGALTPNDVSYGSSKKVWWKCTQGHEWQATVRNRSRGSNCPVCF
ncbi:zinc-ribbon domain-containing protein [Priestia megaterium]|uniref:zinc-ribbon domain-containing protein n=1 Tax=Priestia megaterium TaxID=1404 RepID=UPI00398FBDE8